MNYSLIFKQIRDKNNLTQGEFADILSTSRSTISQIEINKQKPTLDIIAAIVRKFSIDANIFFVKKDENQTLVLGEPTENYSKSDHKNVNNGQEIIYLKKIIEEKNKLLEEKERLITILINQNQK